MGYFKPHGSFEAASAYSTAPPAAASTRPSRSPGRWAHPPNGIVAINVVDSLSPTTLTNSHDFAFVVDILIKGAATGNASAVWAISHFPDAVFFFQLGGSRARGTVLPIVGRPFDVHEGKGPTISGVGGAGVLFGMFDVGGYESESVTGTFTVQQASPFLATIAASFQDGLGRPGTFAGELAVHGQGTGCQ